MDVGNGKALHELMAQMLSGHKVEEDSVVGKQDTEIKIDKNVKDPNQEAIDTANIIKSAPTRKDPNKTETEIEEEDVDGIADGILVVTDPEITSEEFEEVADELQGIVDNTEAGEVPFTDKYEGDYILSCPICGGTFVNDTILDSGEDTCPICCKVPDSFVVNGRVENSGAAVDKEEVQDDIEHEENLDEPEESMEQPMDGQDDIDMEYDEENPMRKESKQIGGNKLQEGKEANNEFEVNSYKELIEYAVETGIFDEDLTDEFEPLLDTMTEKEAEEIAKGYLESSFENDYTKTQGGFVDRIFNYEWIDGKPIADMKLQEANHDDIFSYVLQGNYGDGWEEICTAETREEILRDLEDYNENEPEYPHRWRTRLREGKKLQEDEYEDYMENEKALAEDYKERAKKNITQEASLAFDELKDIINEGDNKVDVDGFYFPEDAVNLLKSSDKSHHLNSYMDLTVSNILNLVDDNNSIEEAIDQLFEEYKSDSAFSWADNLITVLGNLDFDVLDDEELEEYDESKKLTEADTEEISGEVIDYLQDTCSQYIGNEKIYFRIDGEYIDDIREFIIYLNAGDNESINSGENQYRDNAFSVSSNIHGKDIESLNAELQDIFKELLESISTWLADKGYNKTNLYDETSDYSSENSVIGGLFCEFTYAEKGINESKKVTEGVETKSFKIGANEVDVEMDGNHVKKIWWTDNQGSTDFNYDEEEDKFVAFNNPNGSFLTANQDKQLKNKIHKIIGKEKKTESEEPSYKDMSTEDLDAYMTDIINKREGTEDGTETADYLDQLYMDVDNEIQRRKETEGKKITESEESKVVWSSEPDYITDPENPDFKEWFEINNYDEYVDEAEDEIEKEKMMQDYINLFNEDMNEVVGEDWNENIIPMIEKQLDDNDLLILLGAAQTWRGTHDAGKVLRGIDELQSLISDYDIIELETNSNRDLTIDLGHHDGTHKMGMFTFNGDTEGIYNKLIELGINEFSNDEHEDFDDAYSYYDAGDFIDYLINGYQAELKEFLVPIKWN